VSRSPAQALAFLKQAGYEAWYEYYFASPFYSRARERYVRAGLEAVQGDPRRAIELFSGFEGYSAYDVMYAAPSHLRRAILYERLGDTRAAASHYARFLELWKDCDPELRPLVDQARAGLARVSAAGAAR
jgi:tetratricopeptide (TPR) repeat protein